MAFFIAVGSSISFAPSASADTGDYPYASYNGPGTDPSQSWWTNSTGGGYSGYGYAYRNCTDYVAWKLQSLGVADVKTRGLGNGNEWASKAAGRSGVTVNDTPAYGAAAVQTSGTYGHVAFVQSVNTDGTITVSEYNHGWPLDGNYGTRTGTVGALGFVKFVHFGLSALAQTPPSSQSIATTSSSDDTQYSGDFNGDAWSDIAVLHQLGDGGIGVHVLYGNTGTYMLNNASTWIRNLAGADGWDWTKLKIAAGKFNSDQYADIALLHQRTDGGADIHVLYGGVGTSIFTNVSYVRSLTATDGWDWTKMKVVAGDANGDAWDDLVISHKSTDGGAGIHILYGNVGVNMFANSSTWVRTLPASQGWDWTKMKLALGRFNSDGAADLAILHQVTNDGADIHVLYGGSNAALFSNVTTIVRQLPATAGWAWSKIKIAAGDFNGDAWSDITLLHQLGDGGIGVHVLYGNTGSYMFTNAATWIRNLAGSDGWDWTKAKVTASDFNGDAWSDIALLHQLGDGGIGVHVLYGNTGAYTFANTTTSIRSLSGTNGWDWNKVKVS